MEDFIYIILGIVWLVISILGGLKKKQASPTTQSRPQPQEETLPEPGPMPEIEDMLDDFFGTGKKRQQPEHAEEEEVYHPQHEQYLPQNDEVVYESYEEPAEQDYPKYETKYAVSEGYEFSSQVMHGTLDNILEQYRLSDERAKQEDSQMAVEDLDTQGTAAPAFEFDARTAIIYSEIINRKY